MMYLQCSCFIINFLWEAFFLDQKYDSHILVNCLFHIQDFFFFSAKLGKDPDLRCSLRPCQLSETKQFKLPKCQKVSERV